jgi:hypothetical protein
MYMLPGGAVAFDLLPARWMFHIRLHTVTYCLVSAKFWTRQFYLCIVLCTLRKAPDSSVRGVSCVEGQGSWTVIRMTRSYLWEINNAFVKLLLGEHQVWHVSKTSAFEAIMLPDAGVFIPTSKAALMPGPVLKIPSVVVTTFWYRLCLCKMCAIWPDIAQRGDCVVSRDVPSYQSNSWTGHRSTCDTFRGIDNPLT